MLCKKRSFAHERSGRPRIPRAMCAADRDGPLDRTVGSAPEVSKLALMTRQSECVPEVHPQRLIPAKAVRELLGGICDFTLYRWLRREALELPRPVYLGRRRYWREADLIAWLDAQSRKDPG